MAGGSTNSSLTTGGTGGSNNGGPVGVVVTPVRQSVAPPSQQLMMLVGNSAEDRAEYLKMVQAELNKKLDKAIFKHVKFLLEEHCKFNSPIVQYWLEGHIKGKDDDIKLLIYNAVSGNMKTWFTIIRNNHVGQMKKVFLSLSKSLRSKYAVTDHNQSNEEISFDCYNNHRKRRVDGLRPKSSD